MTPTGASLEPAGPECGDRHASHGWVADMWAQSIALHGGGMTLVGLEEALVCRLKCFLQPHHVTLILLPPPHAGAGASESSQGRDSQTPGSAVQGSLEEPSPSEAPQPWPLTGDDTVSGSPPGPWPLLLAMGSTQGLQFPCTDSTGSPGCPSQLCSLPAVPIPGGPVRPGQGSEAAAAGSALPAPPARARRRGSTGPGGDEGGRYGKIVHPHGLQALLLPWLCSPRAGQPQSCPVLVPVSCSGTQLAGNRRWPHWA